MVNVHIRDVDDATWRRFKAEAALHGASHGEFFTRVVQEWYVQHLPCSAQEPTLALAGGPGKSES